MSYIVCGWYTPDYYHWVAKLVASLDKLAIPHDFVQVAKVDGGWERNTLNKARQVELAMGRHPDKTVIFLDVDCEVRAPLDSLADTQADVLISVRVKRRSDGVVKWGNVRSGTMVLRPTPGARELVSNWVSESAKAQYGDDDQTTLMLALAKSHNCTYSSMHGAYCAVASDRLDNPIIFHDSASKNVSKITRLKRRINKFMGVTSIAA